MIASQRKAHKVIWIVLAISLVAFLFLSIGKLDLSAPSKTLPKQQVVATLKNNTVMITVREPLKSASSLVYELTVDGATGTVLGQINTIGSYTFKVPNGTKGIVIIDKIKNNQLFKTTF